MLRVDDILVDLIVKVESAERTLVLQKAFDNIKEKPKGSIYL